MVVVVVVVGLAVAQLTLQLQVGLVALEAGLLLQVLIIVVERVCNRGKLIIFLISQLSELTAFQANYILIVRKCWGRLG